MAKNEAKAAAAAQRARADYHDSRIRSWADQQRARDRRAARKRDRSRTQEIRDLESAWAAILNIHRVEFPATAAPIAPTQRQRQDADTGPVASTWEALQANEPDAVLALLASAFADNDAAASAVGLDGDQVTIVVVVPPSEAVPTQRPVITAQQKVELRPLTASERGYCDKALVSGYALVTVKEAFAVAPGLTSARVIAVRPTPGPAGSARGEVVLAGVFRRAPLAKVRWREQDAARIAADISDGLVWNLTSDGGLGPVDLTEEPGLRDLLAILAFEDAPI